MHSAAFNLAVQGKFFPGGPDAGISIRGSDKRQWKCFQWVQVRCCPAWHFSFFPSAAVERLKRVRRLRPDSRIGIHSLPTLSLIIATCCTFPRHSRRRCRARTLNCCVCWVSAAWVEATHQFRGETLGDDCICTFISSELCTSEGIAASRRQATKGSRHFILTRWILFWV